MGNPNYPDVVLFFIYVFFKDKFSCISHGHYATGIGSYDLVLQHFDMLFAVNDSALYSPTYIIGSYILFYFDYIGDVRTPILCILERKP